MWATDIGGESASRSGGREAENIAAVKVSFHKPTGGIEDPIGRPVEPGRKCGFRAVWGKLVNDPAKEIRVEQISCRIKYPRLAGPFRPEAKMLWVPSVANLSILPVPVSETNRLPFLSKANPSGPLKPVV